MTVQTGGTNRHREAGGYGARVSVLMPVYNGVPYIREAVESVLAQDEQDWELVISDNGSTDGTRDYLRSLQDARIRVHLQQANLGIFGNLNFLLAQAQASIGKILCADDRLLPGALASVTAFMEDRPWCAVSRCLNLDDKRRFRATNHLTRLESRLPSRICPAAAVLTFATFGNVVGNLSKAACRPRQVLDSGGFDQTFPYAGDYEGWMRVASCWGIALQNEELIFERRHAAQSSVVLNRQNELYPQINSLIGLLADRVSAKDLALLRRHWTIYFLAPRIPRIGRQLLVGDVDLARIGLSDLPLNIPAASVIAAYPSFKLSLPPARATANRLFSRIIELNQAAT